MLSDFSKLTELQKKEMVAKIIHHINYSQESYEVMAALVNQWDANPKRQFQLFTPNQLTNGTTIN